VGFSAADIAPPNAATVQNFTATGNPRVFTLEVEIGHPRVMSTNIDMLAGAYTDAAGNASAASSLTIPGWDQLPQPGPEVMVVDGVPVQRVIYDAGPLQPREILTVPILTDNGRSGNARDDLDLPVGDATMKVPRGMGGEVSLNDNLTRGEMVTVIVRSMEQIAAEQALLPAVEQALAALTAGRDEALTALVVQPSWACRPRPCPPAGSWTRRARGAPATPAGRRARSRSCRRPRSPDADRPARRSPPGRRR